MKSSKFLYCVVKDIMSSVPACGRWSSLLWLRGGQTWGRPGERWAGETPAADWSAHNYKTLIQRLWWGFFFCCSRVYVTSSSTQLSFINRVLRRNQTAADQTHASNKPSSDFLLRLLRPLMASAHSRFGTRKNSEPIICIPGIKHAQISCWINVSSHFMIPSLFHTLSDLRQERKIIIEMRGWGKVLFKV